MSVRQGRASRVTDLGDGTVLRVGGDPEREARIMALVQSSGFPVPRVQEVRPDALVLERISGGTMADDLRRRPWMAWRDMAALAGLHERLHLIRSRAHEWFTSTSTRTMCWSPIRVRWSSIGRTLEVVSPIKTSRSPG
jgi:hypothetical protein